MSTIPVEGNLEFSQVASMIRAIIEGNHGFNQVTGRCREIQSNIHDTLPHNECGKAATADNEIRPCQDCGGGDILHLNRTVDENGETVDGGRMVCQDCRREANRWRRDADMLRVHSFQTFYCRSCENARLNTGNRLRSQCECLERLQVDWIEARCRDHRFAELQDNEHLQKIAENRRRYGQGGSVYKTSKKNGRYGGESAWDGNRKPGKKRTRRTTVIREHPWCRNHQDTQQVETRRKDYCQVDGTRKVNNGEPVLPRLQWCLYCERDWAPYY